MQIFKIVRQNDKIAIKRYIELCGCVVRIVCVCTNRLNPIYNSKRNQWKIVAFKLVKFDYGSKIRFMIVSSRSSQWMNSSCSSMMMMMMVVAAACNNTNNNKSTFLQLSKMILPLARNITPQNPNLLRLKSFFLLFCLFCSHLLSPSRVNELCVWAVNDEWTKG